MRRISLAMACLAFSFSQSSAFAGSTTVTGTGVWDGSAPTTAESAPGEGFSFSFDLPSPISSNPTNQPTNFVYRLGGTTIGVGLSLVEFFDSPTEGLFDIVLSDGMIVSAYGAVVETGLTISVGGYAAQFSLNDDFPFGAGGVLIRSIPEPMSVSLLGFGLAGMVLARNPRRTSVALQL